MNEQELIAQSRQGDLESFNQLVELYQGQVYSLAFRMMGSVSSAEDAAQETFLSAFRNVAAFRGGSFRAWLLRIATNACYDQLRSPQRRRSVSMDAMLEDPAWQPRSSDESPEERALRSELSRELSRGLETLPGEQRAVLLLSDVQGLSYEETAQATGSSLGTVKSRLSRARAHMRDYLAQHGELLPEQFRQSERVGGGKWRGCLEAGSCGGGSCSRRTSMAG